MKNGKRIESVNGESETSLPEDMIHHIQSFMTGKEAARTAILSKSWYNAWLTRPALVFDDHDFSCHGKESADVFKEFTTKTMQRYQDLGLKIECFTLCNRFPYSGAWANRLIVDAMKIGATDVQLKLRNVYTTVPQELLGSETLTRLSLSCCGVDGKHVSFSSLKSLKLSCVTVRSVEFKDIISCCNSLEELSLSCCYDFKISENNLYELHKLRRLFLDMVYVDSMFFTEFSSRFPCLEDLSILECDGYTERIEFASTTVQTLSYKPCKKWCRATFDVPNIRKFTYSGSALPQFSVNGALREWKLDISITHNRLNKLSWFLNLKKVLTKFRLSRIFLSIHLMRLSKRHGLSEHEVVTEAVPNPLVVENLTIDAPSSLCCALLVRLFGICRPNFITHYWLSDECDGGVKGKNECLGILCERLVQQLIPPNSGIPDQNMFGQFGLKKVNVEDYEMFVRVWQPLLLKKPLDASETPAEKQKIRFELIWG